MTEGVEFADGSSPVATPLLARRRWITYESGRMNIQARAFDTGGTVLDWHSGLVRPGRHRLAARD